MSYKLLIYEQQEFKKKRRKHKMSDEDYSKFFETNKKNIEAVANKKFGLHLYLEENTN